MQFKRIKRYLRVAERYLNPAGQISPEKKPRSANSFVKRNTDICPEPTKLTMVIGFEASDDVCGNDDASGSLNKQSWPVLSAALGADHVVTHRHEAPVPLPGAQQAIRPPWYEAGWQQQRLGTTSLRA